ncbi:hypothetical protein [Rhodosalinus sp.]|uniref:hypothetical protein n=1 Tax=Rhodosalinus sp. TaxID=2047741 RepID=UPI00397C89B3
MPKSVTADAPADTVEQVKADAQAQAAPDAPTLDVTGLTETAPARVEAPTMRPPGEAGIEAEGEGVTAWHTGKKITAMWCNASNRNAWAAVQGLGWRRIAPANDSAYLTLVMLCSHAEQTNATVNVNIGSDNQIHEIYVW